MIRFYIDFPEGYYWKPGYQVIELPAVPNRGDFLVDLKNQKLEIKEVLFRTDPRQSDDQPVIELVVK